MKLYLSSQGIPDIEAFTKFVGKKPESIRLGLIFHAMDYKPAGKRAEALTKTVSHFESFGITVDVIDLFTNPTQEQLSEYDVVWLNGGNTFYLRWAIDESGTEQLLTEVFDNGVVYGGDSAGAVVAGPVIEHFKIADDPKVAPYLVESGLKYFNLGLIPHWGSEEYRDVLGKIEKSFQDDGYQTIRMSDESYVLIENGRVVDKKF